LAKISLIKRIDATKLHARTLAPIAGPEVNIPFGALVESIGGDHDRAKFLFLGEPYSVRREVFLDAIGPEESAKHGAPAADAPPDPLPRLDAVAAAAVNGVRLKFERLDAGAYSLARAKVPGGWLIVSSGGAAFYPDPAHEWDGSSLD